MQAAHAKKLPVRSPLDGQQAKTLSFEGFLCPGGDVVGILAVEWLAAEVTDHRMIAALLMRADDGTTKVMAAADAALPPETSPVPSLTPEVGEEVVVPEGNPGTTAAPDPNPVSDRALCASI